MTKAFKYRIYPKKSQKFILREALDGCRWEYNQFLEQRKTNWEDEQKLVSMCEQIKKLSQMKRENSQLKQVHSQVLQNVATQIDLVFKASALQSRREAQMI